MPKFTITIEERTRTVVAIDDDSAKTVKDALALARTLYENGEIEVDPFTAPSEVFVRIEDENGKPTDWEEL